MVDPEEGVAADRTIRTGARRDRVPAAFEPVLADAVPFVGDAGGIAVCLRIGRYRASRVIGRRPAVDRSPGDGHHGERLSARYADRGRGVEAAAAPGVDLPSDTDAAYGFRVFLRHYCRPPRGPGSIHRATGISS